MNSARGALPSRILIAEFDSVAQAERFSAKGTQEAISDLTGMLRVGRLLSGEILVTDAMLLDGAYFVALGPEGVLRELGASDGRYPLIVTGAWSTLQEGLESRLRDAGFDWSLPEVENRRSIPSRVRDRWKQWVDLVEAGLVRYEKQDGKFSLPSVPAGSFPKTAAEEGELEELSRALDGELRRSDAFKRIDGVGLDPSDAELIKGWWNGRYLRAIASRSGADWLSFEERTAPELSEQAGREVLPLPARLLEWARVASPASVALAWDGTVAQRSRMRKNASRAAIRDLAFRASQVAEGASRGKTIVNSLLRLGVAVLAVLLAVPRIDEIALDSPITWVLFAGVIVTTIPFDALLTLLQMLRRDPVARLILHGRGDGT